jgi:hypothetical protein
VKQQWLLKLADMVASNDDCEKIPGDHMPQVNLHDQCALCGCPTLEQNFTQ